MRKYMHRATGLTVEQVCRITGATPNTVRGWIHRGHLTRNEWGLVDPEEFRVYMEIRLEESKPFRVMVATPPSAWED